MKEGKEKSTVGQWLAAGPKKGAYPLLVGLVAFSLVLAGLNLYYTVNMGRVMHAHSAQLSQVGNSQMASAAPAGSTSGGSRAGLTQKQAIEQVASEVIPTGTPELYGEALGISYDKPTDGLDVLVGLHNSIQLEGADQQKYIEIATAQDTACEYCCGIGDNGFGTGDGRLACGCAHNIAFSGLTKWLLQNSGYSNKEIKEEIQNWKALFFPKQVIQEAIQLKAERGEISQSTLASLPDMVGGC